MPRSLTPEHLGHVLTTLDSRFDAQIGPVRLLGRALPDGAVCAILPNQDDGVLRIVYDPNKPNAVAHASAMLREWWASFLVPVVLEDGTVELRPQPCPAPAEHPAQFRLVS